MNRRACPYPVRGFQRSRGGRGRHYQQRNQIQHQQIPQPPPQPVPVFVPPVSYRVVAATPILKNPMDSMFNRFEKRKVYEVVDLLNTSVPEDDVDMVESSRTSPFPANSEGKEPSSPPTDIPAVRASCSNSAAPSKEMEVVLLDEAADVPYIVSDDSDSDIQIINGSTGNESADNGSAVSSVNIDDDVVCTDDVEPSASDPKRNFRPALEDSLVKGTMQETKGVVIPRVWEEIKPLVLKDNVKQTVIRVCSYNVLCQTTIAKTMYLYKHTKDNGAVLNWEDRWPLLAQNLEHIDADVFGLQEVQKTHYDSYFLPLMSRKGYGAHYEQKDAPQLDGCALFYRRDKFEYILSRSIRYFHAEGTNLDKPQIAQMVRLRCKTTNKQILVANTHIIFNMKRGDIKLAQLTFLLATIDEELKLNGWVPFIILGDFNIHPNSYIHNFMLNSRLFMKGLPRNTLAGEDGIGGPVVTANEIIPPGVGIGRDCMLINRREPRAPVEEDCLTHPFNLWSATAPSREHADLMRGVSTYHADSGNPDFIFYSCKRKYSTGKVRSVIEYPSFRLIRRMSLPKLQLLQKTLGPWPNRHVPSDHIPLVAEFQLRQADD